MARRINRNTPTVVRGSDLYEAFCEVAGLAEEAITEADEALETVGGYNARISAVESSVEGHETRLAQAEDDIDEIETDVGSLTTAVANLDATVNQHTTLIYAHDEDLGELKPAMEQAQDDIETLYDTKLGKVTSTTEKVYAVDNSGQKELATASSATEGALLKMGTNGRFTIADPVSGSNPVSLSYAQEHFGGEGIICIIEYQTGVGTLTPQEAFEYITGTGAEGRKHINFILHDNTDANNPYTGLILSDVKVGTVGGQYLTLTGLKNDYNTETHINTLVAVNVEGLYLSPIWTFHGEQKIITEGEVLSTRVNVELLADNEGTVDKNSSAIYSIINSGKAVNAKVHATTITNQPYVLTGITSVTHTNESDTVNILFRSPWGSDVYIQIEGTNVDWYEE